MEEVTNLNHEEVLEIIKEFNLEPRTRDVIITVNTHEEYDEEGISLSDNSFSDEQFVIAVGSHVHDIMEGDRIILDIEAMSTSVMNPENTYESMTQIKIFPVKYKDRMFALVNERVIKLIIK